MTQLFYAGEKYPYERHKKRVRQPCCEKNNKTIEKNIPVAH